MQPQVQPFFQTLSDVSLQVSDSDSSESESESDDKSIDRSSEREKELTHQGFLTREWNHGLKGEMNWNKIADFEVKYL